MRKVTEKESHRLDPFIPSESEGNDIHHSEKTDFQYGIYSGAGNQGSQNKSGHTDEKARNILSQLFSDHNRKGRRLKLQLGIVLEELMD